MSMSLVQHILLCQYFPRHDSRYLSSNSKKFSLVAFWSKVTLPVSLSLVVCHAFFSKNHSRYIWYKTYFRF
ncbi:Uncharacterized protein TCM_007018 [Theobroma cacao]|uniref:Uncharacterized protein n=1 Tax=Theobroma cacao TaxID=3641 RepID=A0A061DZU2_THECC|nr:Uncharacterized protein TCM_007018 [Theobroma cacao]